MDKKKDDKVELTITEHGIPIDLSNAVKVEYIFKESISGKEIIKEAEIVDSMEGKVKVKYPKQMLSTEKWSLQFKIDMNKAIFFSGLTKFGLNKGEIMTVDEEKKEEIKKLKAMAIDKMNSTIDHLSAMILICETDKGDDRYDVLHDVKNRVTTARKRIKRIAYMDDEGEIIQEG